MLNILDLHACHRDSVGFAPPPHSYAWIQVVEYSMLEAALVLLLIDVQESVLQNVFEFLANVEELNHSSLHLYRTAKT